MKVNFANPIQLTLRKTEAISHCSILVPQKQHSSVKFGIRIS